MTGESAVVTIEHANVNEDDAYTALTSITFDDNPATGFSPQIVTQSGYARFLRASISISGFSTDVIRTIRVNLLLKESV